MAFAARLASADTPAARWLRSIGVRSPSNLSSLFKEEALDGGRPLMQLAADLGIADPGTLEQAEADLYSLIAQARAEAAAEAHDFATTATWDLQAAAVLKRKKEKENEEEERRRKIQITSAKAAKPPPPTKPRHGSARARLVDAEPSTRAEADQEERRRWTQELVRMLTEIDAPCIRALAGSAHPQRLLALQTGGRRPTTLRARVREWKRYQAWLVRAKGRSWPMTVADILDYALERLEEPSTKSVLRSFWATLNFMERLSGREVQFGRLDTVDLGLKAMIAEAATRLDGRPVKRALPPPVNMVIMLEKTVMDGTSLLYDRLIGWWMLVSLWSCCRYDDHRGINPAGIKDGEQALDFVMERTKTTGPDKQVKQKHGVVSKGAYFSEPNWARHGWELWKTAAPYARDYLLCKPGGADGCIPEELGYVAYSAHVRGLIAQLKCGDSGELLGEDLAMCYSPHSFRAFLPSCLKALEAGPETMSWLSAWQVKGGEMYARTGRHQTIRLQNKLSDIVCAHLGTQDPIGEHDSLLQVKGLLGERGVEEESAARVVKDLCAFPGTEGVAPTWASWDQTDAPERKGDAPEVTETGSETKPMWDKESQTSAAKEAASSHEPPRHAKNTANGDSKEGAANTAGTGQNGEPSQGYTVSVSRKKGIRTLHLLGACYRKPGIDYAVFEYHGLRMPRPHEYNAYCRSCWRGDANPLENQELDANSSSCDTADESSSTSGE